MKKVLIGFIAIGLLTFAGCGTSSIEGGGVTDSEGNAYKTVIIGSQEWMAENLRTAQYADGTSITNVTGQLSWKELDWPAWCHYENDNQYESTYGKLYNWYAVETGKLCPTGWHVPSEEEWTVLTNYLAANGHHGKIEQALKSTSGWTYNGTDDYGWHGLPSGGRTGIGSFESNSGMWWSSSEVKKMNTQAHIRTLHFSDPEVSTRASRKWFGESVRCLKGAVDDRTSSSSQDGEVTTDAGNTEVNTDHTKGTNYNGKTNNTGENNTETLPSPILIEPATSLKKKTASSIQYGDGATDADKNLYTSVKIGTQEWMVENLKTTTYADGTSIPNVTDDVDWYYLETAAWSYYNNDSQYDSTYGKLYNWYAVETEKLCPTGWHVPKDEEWTVLTDYLVTMYNGYAGMEGIDLKSKSGWNDFTGGITVRNAKMQGNGDDAYGFNGLPGGARADYGGACYSMGYDGYWWSSSEDDVEKIPRFLSLGNYDTGVLRHLRKKKAGFSVRCLKN